MLSLPSPRPWFVLVLMAWGPGILLAQSPGIDTTRVYGASLGVADSVRKLTALGHLSMALSYAQRWVAAAPSDGAAHHAVAASALLLRQVDLAVQEGELSVTLDPANPAYHITLGRAYFDRATAGDSPATREAAGLSMRTFERAIALDSLSLEAREYLFTFHLVAPTTAGASRATARRIAAEMERIHRPRGLWARLRLAATLGPDEAIRAAVTEAMDVAGTAADSSGLVMATMASTAGSARYPTMRENLVRMIYARFPQDPRVIFQRARLWVTQGKELAAAERLLMEYVAAPIVPRSPARGTALWWLGQAYEKQGQRDDALATYRACATTNPPLAECTREVNRLTGTR